MITPMKGLSKRGSYNLILTQWNSNISTVKKKSVKQLINHSLQAVSLNQL